LRLARIFNQRTTEDWPWPEDRLTYANARLAQSLLLAGQGLNEEQMIQTGVKTLAWLLRIQTSTEGHFSPVGNQGWYPKGGARARYGQQPIEAGATAEACIAAWQATGDSAWLDRAQWCMAWFLGGNDGGHPMIDADTFGCYDGLYAEGINRNQGAESVLSWILATLSFLELHVTDRSEQQDVV
jgi:hypothetical protein